MTDKISSKDPRIRITTVQEALRNYINAIPPDTRATFISFNTGIASERELVLRSDAERQEVMQWVNQLSAEANKNGDTYLWSTLRRALKIASNYSKQNPEQTVVVRVLTDGQDTEKDLRGRSRWTLDQVLSEFPDLDGRAIRANLVLLGDLEIPFRTKHLGLDVVRDPHFSFMFPPVIDWAPKPPQVGKDITFFDNSRSSYQFWDWRLDGTLIGQKPSVTHRFSTAGEHVVQLVVTGTGGTKDAATVRVNVLAAEKDEPMIPSFVFAPASPEPGQTVKFMGRSSGKPVAYSWQIGGQEFATSLDVERNFPQEGTTEVRFVVRDAKGNQMEKTQAVSVVEPVILVEFKALAEAGHEQLVQFGNETQGRVASFEWDFGDGQKSTERNPAHTYRNEGAAPLLVNVTLRATTPTGKTRASQPHPVKIFPRVRPEEIPPPKAAFRVLGDRFKIGTLVQFIDDSTGAIDLQEWDFHREGRSVAKNPEFRFETPGSKKIQLTVRGKGGTTSASQTILIPEPDKNIDVHWIDQHGQNTVPPKEIDFGEIPVQHIRNNQYSRPVGTEFEIVLPQELPSGGGAAFSLEGKLAAFSVIRVLPGAEKVGPVLANGLVPASGRFRLDIIASATEDDYDGKLVIRPEGNRVTANNTNAPVEVPIHLKIGTPGRGGILFFLVLLAVAGYLVWRFIISPGGLLGALVQVNLTEVAGVVKDGQSKTALQPSATIDLRMAESIYFGRDGNVDSSVKIYDLGAPAYFLIRQKKGLELRDRNGGKPRPLNPSDSFTVTDASGRNRQVRATATPKSKPKPRPPAGKK